MTSPDKAAPQPVATAVTPGKAPEKAPEKPLRQWQIVTVWVLRVLIGGLFVFSGVVKGIDLWGFMFKLEDYLAAWDITQPRSVVLVAAMGVSAYETVFGFLLLTGCYRRVAPWALTLSMAVMLPLTAYIAVADPVTDCGCFGDFWVISNTATFLKNIAITAALIFLIIYSPRMKSGLYKPAIQWVVGAAVTIYIIMVGLYGYNIQPMLDFRPYPPGTQLVAAGTDEDEDAGDDEAMPVFVYEKGGERREFPADNLPDSTWSFVERKGFDSEAPTPHPDGFAIFDGDEDVTRSALSGEGTELILVIPELRRADISYTYYINDLYEKADSAGIAMVALIGSGEKGIAVWKDFSMAAYPCYSVEDTTLKELSRGLMSLVLLQDGRIKGKATVSSLVNGNYDDTDPLTAVADLSDTPHGAIFALLTAAFAIFLLLLYLLQRIIIGLLPKNRAARQAGNELPQT